MARNKNPMCPKYCKVALKKVKVKKTEVDQCPKCEGVWFDTEGDEMLEVLRTGYGDAPDPVKKSWEYGGGQVKLGTPLDYNCPRCGSRLRAYDYLASEGGAFEIDGCPKGCGVWLDDGELDSAYQILRYFKPGELRPKKKQAKAGLFERILGFRTAR